MAMLYAASAPERVRSLTLYAAFARSTRAPTTRPPGAPRSAPRRCARWSRTGARAASLPLRPLPRRRRQPARLARPHTRMLARARQAARWSSTGASTSATCSAPSACRRCCCTARATSASASPIALPRRTTSRRPPGRARGQRHAAVPRRLGRRGRRDRRVPDRRPPPARARPRALYRPVHRHRRLDGQGRRARRRAVARPARRARPARAGQPRPPPRPRDQVRSATASWRSSTARRAPCVRPRRSCPTSRRSDSRSAGLHTGEVELVGDDVAGLAVHIAARVMGEAPPAACSPRAPCTTSWSAPACASRSAAARRCAACPASGACGRSRVNFARDVVAAAPPGKLAIVELARDGARREWRFGEVAEQAALLHAHLEAQGARRGDVVLTLLGNRPEVLAMVALPRLRRAAVHRAAAPEGPAAAARRHRGGARDRRRAQPRRARGVGWAGHRGRRGGACRPLTCRRLPSSSRATRAWSPSPPAPRASRRRCCTGRATCPASACRPSTGWPPQEGDLVWCTAASGWSKSARNAFIAPWLRRRGPAARRPLRPRRAARHRRARGRERALHGADRVPRDRQPHAAAADRVAARTGRRRRGVDPEALGTWHDATGLWIRDGYGQTETGQLTGHYGAAPRLRLDGPPAPASA